MTRVADDQLEGRIMGLRIWPPVSSTPDTLARTRQGGAATGMLAGSADPVSPVLRSYTAPPTRFGSLASATAKPLGYVQTAVSTPPVAIQPKLAPAIRPSPAPRVAHPPPTKYGVPAPVQPLPKASGRLAEPMLPPRDSEGPAPPPTRFGNYTEATLKSTQCRVQAKTVQMSKGIDGGKGGLGYGDNDATEEETKQILAEMGLKGIKGHMKGGSGSGESSQTKQEREKFNELKRISREKQYQASRPKAQVREKQKSADADKIKAKALHIKISENEKLRKAAFLQYLTNRHYDLDPTTVDIVAGWLTDDSEQTLDEWLELYGVDEI